MLHLSKKVLGQQVLAETSEGTSRPQEVDVRAANAQDCADIVLFRADMEISCAATGALCAVPVSHM